MSRKPTVPPSAERLIYVLEDDTDIACLVCRELAKFGYTAEAVATGQALLRRQRQKPAKLCIVDLGLPDLDGLSVVRRLGEESRCAIIILTGRHDLADRVTGLELGADDYVTKPFEPRELVARVRSVLRRIAEATAAIEPSRAARFAGWTFNPSSYRLTSPAGDDCELGKAEADLLIGLLSNPNRILTRDQLLPNRARPALDRTIDARISRLRKRLKDDPDTPRLIKTVYGAGYMLAAGVEWDWLGS
jgi:DNA-binding response OmpR family regulator